MLPKLNAIMLIDDDLADNMYHSRIIKKAGCADHILVLDKPEEALSYLQNQDGIQPDLIFLDINMPRMNGWEFLDRFRQLPENQNNPAIVVMLTTSLNPDDAKKAGQIDLVSKFLAKPLTPEALEEVLRTHFGE
ncbi:MAG: response regulator [Bacteroidia bacterium]|nr:response regulator [Bacteroidia bacterium]